MSTNNAVLPIKIDVANFTDTDKYDISLVVNGKVKYSFEATKSNYTLGFFNFLFSSVKYDENRGLIINIQKERKIAINNYNATSDDIVHDYHEQYVEKQIAVAKYLGWEYKKLDIPLSGNKMLRFELFTSTLTASSISRVIWRHVNGQRLHKSLPSESEIVHTNIVFVANTADIDISRTLTTEFESENSTLKIRYPNASGKTSRLLYLNSAIIQNNDKKLYEKLFHEEMESCDIVNILREKRNELFQFYNIRATVVTF